MQYWENTSLETLAGYDDKGNFHVEKWKDIPNYIGKYQASTFGRIKSFRKYGGINERIIKLQFQNNGYLAFVLSKNDIPKRVSVQRIIGIVFIKNPKRRPVVHHRDTDKTNNCVWNLKWTTHRKNTEEYQKTQNRTSKYIGVWYHKESKTWCSGITYNGGRCMLGYFKLEIEAHYAYQKALKEINEGTFVPAAKNIKTSKYKGVYFEKESKKWRGQVTILGKHFRTGRFDTEKEVFDVIQNKRKEIEGI